MDITKQHKCDGLFAWNHTMTHAAFKDRLLQNTFTMAGGQQGHELWLQVSRKAWVRECPCITVPEHLRTIYLQAPSRHFQSPFAQMIYYIEI